MPDLDDPGPDAAAEGPAPAARALLVLGALTAGLGVAAGAFGAHALAEHLGPERLATWRTAVLYQLVHALGLLAVGGLAARWPGRAGLVGAGWLLAAGVVLFSGSLYALALGAPRGLGVLTPLGGLALLAGWVRLAASLRR